MPLPEGTSRDQYVDALTCAMVWEMDWDLFKQLGDYKSAEAEQLAKAQYWLSCGLRLKQRYGWIPYPFDELKL